MLTQHQIIEQDELYHNEERREFLLKAASMLGLAVSAGTVATIVSSCETTTLKSTGEVATLDVSKEAALKNVGGAVLKKFANGNDGNSVVVIRTSASEFLVLTSICTHTGCPVGLPTSPGSNLICPCHGSQFSSNDGSVINGPATAPLKRFSSTFNAGTSTLTISF